MEAQVAAPWLAFGANVDPKATIDGWAERSGLDWEARVATVEYKDHLSDAMISVPSRKVLCRKDTNGFLSVVSDRYKVVQPVAILEFFRDLVEELELFEMEFAGCLSDGRKIVALAKARDEIALGTDRLGRYILLATSYDQSIPTIVKQTSVRVACMNVLDTSGFSKGAVYSRRHSGFFDGGRAKIQLDLENDWGRFRETVEVLASRKVDDAQVQQFMLDVFYPKNRKHPELVSAKGAERRLDEMLSIYHHAPGQQLPTSRNTAWGMLNAVTYYVDHLAKSRTDDLRVDKAWFGDGNLLKKRAMRFATALLN